MIIWGKNMHRKKLSASIIIAIIVIVLTLVSPVVGGNTYNDRTVLLKNSQTFSRCKDSSIKSTPEVVWDNGIDYDGLVASQYDKIYPFDCFQADDFQFENETIVTNVHWIGGYFAGNPEPFDWCISFYTDNGSGLSPEGLPYSPSFAGPFCFTDEEIEKEEPDPGYFDMCVKLTESITFNEGKKYWISIWGVGTIPPQCGWGIHKSCLLNPIVWGSDKWEYKFWTPGKVVLTYNHDMCFQLISESNNPPDVPEINGPYYGKPETLYDFTFNATDPDEDSIMYFVDWGDDNTERTEYSDSGEEITLKHSWLDEGTYIIKAKAKDIHDAESEWASLTVTIPRNKAIINSFFLQFLERFPILSRLQCLLK
jgi:hypothetical protein